MQRGVGTGPVVRTAQAVVACCLACAPLAAFGSIALGRYVPGLEPVTLALLGLALAIAGLAISGRNRRD